MFLNSFIPMDNPASGGKESAEKQIWGRKDRGLKPDVRWLEEEILVARFGISWHRFLCHSLVRPVFMASVKIRDNSTWLGQKSKDNYAEDLRSITLN
jgi:hypothetical protein